MGEVPSRIAALIREASSVAAPIAAELDALATSLEQEGNIHTLHNSVDMLRRSLMKIDLRLEDVYALLGSYQRALVELKEEVQPNETEIEEDE